MAIPHFYDWNVILQQNKKAVHQGRRRLSWQTPGWAGEMEGGCNGRKEAVLGVRDASHRTDGPFSAGLWLGG